MNRTIGLVAALLVSGIAFAEENAYLIQCTILDGNRALGSPAVVAESGEQVTVSVTGTYELTLTAEEQDGGRVALAAEISLGGEVHSPDLVLELDRPAEIRIGDTTLKVNVSKVVPDDV